MRLIDADELKDVIINSNLGEYTELGDYCKLDALNIVDQSPTIDAEPVKHVRWIQLDRDIVVCSECGRHENALLVDSCPYCHCGAKMDGGADE